MLYDGIKILEGSSIENLTIKSGSSFPSNANIAELFYRSDELKLYVHNGTAWTEVGSGGGGGGGSLDAITAAAGTNTIANANYAQNWQWALTSEISAIKISETSASSGGTGDQCLFEISTNAASTSQALRITYSGETLMAAGVNGAVNLTGAASSVTTGDGGAIVITGGLADSAGAYGGDVSLSGGAADGTPSGYIPGNVIITGGEGQNGIAGGNVLITGGVSDNVAGGNIIITSGNTTSGGNSGYVEINGSNAIGDGGGILLTAGNSSSSGQGGSVLLTAGESTSGTGGVVEVVTGGVTRFTITADGDWQLAGSAGTSGQVLTSNGAGAPPTWQPGGGGGEDGATLSAVAGSTTYYLGLSANSSGTWTDARVDTTNLYYTSGDQTLYATNFNTSSDANMKVDVHTINNCIDIVGQMRGVGFNWKDNGRKSYGVIAQELEQILPELVNTVDGKKSVNYNAIIGFLIQAVKELNDKLENR